MTGPPVSVVTPVLDRASTIERCLRSVSAQSYPDLEHVVVDGGSSDGTADVVRSFRGRHPVRLISEPDDGMYDAIDKGLDAARGEVLAYLNSDDLYLPWSVGAAVAGLREEGADLVFGDMGVLHREERRRSFHLQFYPPFDLAHYTHVATLGQPTVFWRRSLMERVGGFDRTYRLLGDCEYWLRAASAGARIERLDEVLAVQVEHEGTLRATQQDRLREEFARLRAQYAPVAPPPPRPTLSELHRKVVWRRYQVALLRASRRPGRGRWPLFTGFLARHGVVVRPGYLLWHLLPGPLRPPSTSLLDDAAFERALEAAFGEAAGAPPDLRDTEPARAARGSDLG